MTQGTCHTQGHNRIQRRFYPELEDFFKFNISNMGLRCNKTSLCQLSGGEIFAPDSKVYFPTQTKIVTESPSHHNNVVLGGEITDRIQEDTTTNTLEETTTHTSEDTISSIPNF